jgi:hypothetical protein
VTPNSCDDLGVNSRRLPWALALPLMAFGSWSAHAFGRLSHPAVVDEGSLREAEAHAHSVASSVGAAAVLAPFAAIGVVVLVAWLFAAARKKPWRGTPLAFFLVLPSVAYALGELAERVFAGEALAEHASQEPALLLALVLHVAIGVAAYVIARLLLAGVAVVRALIENAPERQAATGRDFVPQSPELPPVLWTCIVGARGLRGPPPVPSLS